MVGDWFSIWWEPTENDYIAYLSLERIAEIGGNPPNIPWNAFQVNQGNAVLMKWCRLNCREPGKPVNHKGKSAWAFRHLSDAMLFKLTWG